MNTALAENVDTPATTSSSKSVCPSISTPPVPISTAPSILTLLLNVAAPATTTSSKSACPSTSIPLVPISNPVALTIPDVTFKPPAVILTSSPRVVIPVTFRPINDPSVAPGTPVSAEPSPEKEVAVTTPTT